MRKFLNVYQFATESVTDYVIRLEKAFALLRDNYPERLTMVDKTQHLRERFYRGLRLEIHQKLTPHYETEGAPYVTLFKRARQLEDKCNPQMNAEARGAIDDLQMKNVINTLKEIKEQIQQHEVPTPHFKKKWKGRYGCYHCGEQGHWRRTCPAKPTRKRRAPSLLREDLQSSSGEVGEPPTPTEELRPTPTQDQRTAKKTKLSTRPQYYNPEPVARMFGRTNEAQVEVNGVPTTCLVDTGATVTIVNAEFCEQLGLEVHSIEGLITVSATGQTNIPYLGYTVATVEFPQIPGYSDEVVMLVISDSSDYASRVPIQIGTRVIAAVTETLRPEDIKHLDETWKQTYVGTLMSCVVQQRPMENGDTFDLKEVQGPVKLKKGVELQPFEQREVWGYTKVRGHSKRVVVCTESEDLLLKGQVMSVSSKSELLPHNPGVKV